MEILSGENACYTLPAFIALRMGIHWGSHPIGKVSNNLPFFQKLIENRISYKTLDTTSPHEVSYSIKIQIMTAENQAIVGV